MTAYQGRSIVLGAAAMIALGLSPGRVPAQTAAMATEGNGSTSVADIVLDGGVKSSALAATEVEDVPVPVSPGAVDTAAGVEARCPTFSWGPVPGTTRQELVVVEVGEEDSTPEGATLLTSVHLPGTVSSWTPSTDQCFQPARTYGWSVRTVGEQGSSAWSETRLFRILTAAETRPAPPVQRQWVDASVRERSTARESAADIPHDEGVASVTAESGIFIEGLSVPAGQWLATAETDCAAGTICVTGVYCGNGNVVLGGGADLLTTSSGLVLYGSYPDELNPPPQTWYVMVLNTSGTPSTFKAHAICTKLSGAP